MQHRPAVTSRFPTAVRRRMWVSAGSLAMLGIPVVTAVALPHMKSRAMVDATILPMKQWAPPPGASLEELTVKEYDSTVSDLVAPPFDPRPLPAATRPQPQVPAPIRRMIPAPARVTLPREESATVRRAITACGSVCHSLAVAFHTACGRRGSQAKGCSRCPGGRGSPERAALEE